MKKPREPADKLSHSTNQKNTFTNQKILLL